MKSIKPMKVTFKHAEAEWYNYHNTLKEIVKLREEIMNPFVEDGDENIGGGRTNTTDKPTERIATRLVTSKQLTYVTEIAEAIEQVYNASPDNYKQLVRLKYWSREKDLTWDLIADKLNVHPRTAQRWRDDIIQATMELLGWR